jgi:eukaryotic-like serine/threonine-protein kinase
MPSHPLLAGRYRLESQIATGGVGEVWRAEDTVLTRPVAVKLLRAEFAGHAEMQERFRAEARHAGALSHPAIARVYDYCEPAPEHPAFLVMELVDGPSLAAVLTAGPLGAAQAMDVVAQVASGLQTAHEAALVHRDIKPANLLLAADGQVKITDFGIAHVAGSVPVTRTGTVMGTPAYLAPERVSGASATPVSDLYSLGVVAYECLAGAQPFTGKPLEVAAAHRDLPLPPFPHAVPAEVAQLVADLTAKNPAARPASAQDVATRAARLREDMASGVGGAAAGWLYSVPDTVADIPAPAPALGLNPTLGWRAGPPEPASPAQRARHHQPAGRAPQAGRPRGHRRRWQIAGAVSAAVAAVAATALVALALTPGPARTPVAAGPTGPATQQPPAPSAPATQSPSRTPTTPPAPAAVEVAAASLVGEPVQQVRQQLQLLGLSVRVQRHRSDKETGTVLAVMPNGKVRPASIIVVTVAFMLAQDNNNPGHHHHHHGDGGGGQGFTADGGTVANTAARPAGG